MVKMKLGIPFITRVTLLAGCVVVTSCSSVTIVAIKNNTNELIKFRGQFAYKSYEPYNLDFTLNPGGVDSWRYEIGYFEKKSLDKGLQKIIIKNELGCKVELKRDMIEKIAVKDGMWEINIDNKIMNCK